MGKRKERRLAAQGASRRVKLDLFAEPSGELGSSVNDEVDEGLDQNTRAGVPYSQSPSGNQQDNPLMLLEQYSDDDVDEEEHKRLKHDSDNSSIEQNGKVEEPVSMECEDVEDRAEGSAADQVKKEDLQKANTSLEAPKELDCKEFKGSDFTASVDALSDVKTTQVTDTGNSGIQISGDMTSVWKVVMHEESNQYYYWNTETGETSWEVPDTLVQKAETEAGKEEPCSTDHMGTESTLPTDDTVVADSTENLVNDSHKYDNGLQTDYGDGQNKDEDQEVLNLVADGSLTELRGSGGSTTTVRDDKEDHKLIANEHDEAALSTRLVDYGEYLLKTLKSLKSSKDGHIQGHDKISKYMLEIQIRLSDFKSLSSYGSSLLPYWVLSEGRLKGIERAIDDEISQLSISKQINEVETKTSLGGDQNKPWQSMAVVSEVNGEDQNLLSNVQQPPPGVLDSLQVISREPESSFADDVIVRHNSSSVSPKHFGIGESDKEETRESAYPSESVPEHKPDAGQDVDMDVDMDVDDETTSDQTSGDVSNPGYSASEDIVAQPATCVEYQTSVLGAEFSIPPPPDDGWIPPPPPDNEPIPPPPPDEPPVPAYPQHTPYSETVQAFPYTEQYTYSYPVSGYEYYGPTIPQVSSTNYYATAEGNQINDPQQTQYYGSISSPYPEAASVIVNPVDSVVYYNCNASGAIISNDVQSTEIYVGLAPSNSPSLAPPDQTESLQGLVNPYSSSLLAPKVDADVTISGKSEAATLSIPPFSATNTVPVKNDVSAPSTAVFSSSASTISASSYSASTMAVSSSSASTTTVAPSTTAPKAQSKVLRNKKKMVAVAPTMRSNKKVSSLVDKWKAAKEELHEDDEDEPENAYEMLEKKKQREIEEWRARHVASGEARDNANFQPLGGDWRERVKRKRAQAKKEAIETLIEAPTIEKQPPDLTELAKGLPSGWQAYWDESSKEVYYGNTVTSETTWTRPTS